MISRDELLTQEIARLTPYVEAFRREEARADKLGQELDDLRGAQQTPMRDDIAQMISDGWKSGKSSADVAEEILREFDAAHAQGRPSKFSPGDPVEVRKQNDEIDEIVIRRGDVHIEQMSSDSWFMGVDGADGSYWQFWFGSKNRKSHIEFRHTETVSAAEQESSFTSTPDCPTDSAQRAHLHDIERAPTNVSTISHPTENTEPGA